MKLISKFAFGLYSLMYPFKILGTENIPDDSCVVVCNHFSIVDCMFLYKLCNANCKTLCKKEIMQNKLFKTIVTDFGALPIDRESPNINEMLACLKTLKENKKLCIFPEGTRNKSKTNKLQEIKAGSGIFAVKAKKPILPVMILKKSKIFRKNYLLVGKPFELTEFYNKKLSNEDLTKMDSIIKDKMNAVHLELENLLKKKK